MNLPVKRFNFSSGASSCARPSMVPCDIGEYCLYSEACATIESALSKMEIRHVNHYSNPRIPCMNKIPIDARGIANTYCMLDKGHDGDCK
jgi:hypothetical protein